MSRWTAILAVACGLSATAGFAQQQVTEAKASFVFNGRQIKIDSENEAAQEYAAAFAGQQSGDSAPFIAPMQVADNVPSLSETEVLSFLVNEVAGAKGLLVDARMPDARAKGFIPGSVNLPYLTMTADKSFERDILLALGARALDETYNFSDAQELLVYDLGPSTDEAGLLIQSLLASGYPPEKLKYYRGGMQVWAVLGFSIQEGNG